jgi:hypothetical protein
MAKKRTGEGPADPPPPPWTPPALSGRHKATVVAIYDKPTRSDVSWASFASLVNALGGTIKNGKGSRRRIKVGDRRANLHEPHPGPDMPKGAVEDVRDFLNLIGVRP